jgi:hypothetical protein
MTFYGSLQVVDRDGWGKIFPLEKALFMVGSASVNDIVLPAGSTVAPVHLQVIRPAVDASQVRVVNLSPNPLLLSRANQPGSVELPANGSGDLHDGDMLRLGDFTLAFSVQAQRGVVRSARSQNLGLTLELAGLELRAGKQLAGRLTLTNFGSENRCQFELDLEGLPADCYQIDPSPMLFPQGEERIGIRLYHLGSLPRGGECPITLRATAPAAYPTEEVELRLSLQVACVREVKVTFSDSSQPACQPLEAPAPRFRNGNARAVVSDERNRSAPAELPSRQTGGESGKNGSSAGVEFEPPAQPMLPAPEGQPTEVGDWFSATDNAPRLPRRPRLNGNITILRSSGPELPGDGALLPGGEEPV